MATLPCGFYKTREQIGNIPAGRFVYFHNHGNPGPGIYQPEGWQFNRARFSAQGTTLPTNQDAAKLLEPLLAEGLYVVKNPFYCCEKKCREYTSGTLVQIGYNGLAEPILFTPTWTTTGLVMPEQGNRLAGDHTDDLQSVSVPVAQGAQNGMVH